MRLVSNISNLNALIRVTIGVVLVVWSTARLVKKPWRQSYLFVALMGGMKIGEGILRYCPFVAFMDRYEGFDEEYYFEEGTDLQDPFVE